LQSGYRRQTVEFHALASVADGQFSILMSHSWAVRPEWTGAKLYACVSMLTQAKDMAPKQLASSALMHH